MRLSQFLLLVVVTFVACCSAVTTAENAIQIQKSVTDTNREFTNEGRRSLKGSTKTTDLDAADEERVGSTSPTFMQLFGFVKLPKGSNIPGAKFVKALWAKLGTWDLAKRRKKFESNPHAFGF